MTDAVEEGPDWDPPADVDEARRSWEQSSARHQP